MTVETALLDVTDPDGCARVIDEYEPFALVNNAGYSITGSIEDVTDAEARGVRDDDARTHAPGEARDPSHA